jgi:hypothetical protein
VGLLPDKSSSVDPPGAASVPPSISIFRSTPNCRRTSEALPVDGWPLLFALVAVSGLPNAEI